MKHKVLIILIVIVVIMIWAQSLLPSQISAQESGWFTDYIIRPITEWLCISSVSNLLVRKLAHMFEYFVLGLLVAACWRGKVALSFQVCYLVAFADETMQLLSKRGSSVADIWIDIAGGAIGVGILLLIQFVKREHGEKK